MPPFLTSVEIERADVPDRVHARILREALGHGVDRYRLVRFRRHFQRVAETAPGGAYGYAPRTRRWREYKLKKYGSDTPLVRTGRLRDEAVNLSVITKTQHKATLHIRSYFPLTAERRRELEALSGDDVNYVRGHVGREYRRLARLPENQRRRRRRV